MSMSPMSYLITCPNCNHQYEIWLNQSADLTLEMMAFDKNLDEIYKRHFVHCCPNCHTKFEEKEVC